MMIQKIVVLIEEQVKCRVTEEVAEQLAKWSAANAQLIKSKTTLPNGFQNQCGASQQLQTPQATQLPPTTPYRHHDLLKSNDGKSTKEILMEGDNSYTTSEM